MKLQEYLDWKELTRAQFAAEIGVSEISVGRYVRGERVPEWDVIERIVSKTDGHVSANDWLGQRGQAPRPLERKRRAEQLPAA